MGWFGQKYRYTTVRHSHAILNFFFFFFFFFLDYFCNLNLSRYCAVLMYDISISFLKTWSQKQNSSLVYLVDCRYRNIIWAVIGYLGKTDMKIVSIKMNSNTYVNIINEQLLKYADSIAKQNILRTQWKLILQVKK